MRLKIQPCSILLLLLSFGAASAAFADAGQAASRGPVEEAAERAAEQTSRWNDQLKAVIALNPELASQAAKLDRELAAGAARGPLHGALVLLKDNIETREMPTTAGSLALQDNHTGRDAALTANLREAGLLILGKANLSEWANFRSERSSSGWSAVGGQSRNPHDPSRSPCGSSSGSAIAVAAGITPLAVGTETNGSIVCPAAVNGIVAIKPTIGLVSRRGIVPIAHSQDTAGPMATNVRDAAYLLTAMAAADPLDAASAAAAAYFERDYAESLNPQGLRGKRVGVVRSLAGFHEGVDQLFDQAVADLAAAGALIVDELSLPDYPDGFQQAAYDVLLFEFKHDLNNYLSDLPGPPGAFSLASLIEFNREYAAMEMKWFQQEIFLLAEEKPGLEAQAYRDALARVRGFSRDGIDNLLQQHNLDLLVSPTNTPAWSIDLVVGDRFLGGSSSFAARAGYPHVTVPMGFVHGLPAGLSFYGAAFSEPVLIEAAFAYEQVTAHARPPEGFGDWRPVGVFNR